MNQSSLELLVVLPILMGSAILHEIAHGLAAERLGDPTARARGRITLNPLPHIDWFMTIALPLSLALVKSPVLFGGAKPVPVDPSFFKNPRRGMGLVAVAGPIVNFVIAAVCLGAAHVSARLGTQGSIADVITQLLSLTVLINVVLGTFNLLPVPPLDGGRIAVALLPLPLARKFASLERVGLLLVAVLLLTGLVGSVLEPLLEMVLTWLPTT